MSPKARAADQQRPYIDLLDRVAVLATEDALAYRRIRVHIEAVRHWYASRPGWPVILTRDVVRLVKLPSRPTEGLGMRWAQSPLDYELFAWVLWYGEKVGGEQFLLSDLVQEVEVQAAAHVGPGHVDWDLFAHRQALRRALVALEHMGALRRVDGDTEAWAMAGEGNTLYEFTHLAQYLDVHLPESTLRGLAGSGPGLVAPDRSVAGGFLADAPAGDGGRHPAGDGPSLPAADGAAAPAAPPDGGGQVGPEQRLYRTLLLSPALYAADDPEAFDLLRGRDRRERIARDLQETFGWDLEVTPSYACLLRPSASEVAERSLFPFRGALAHVILLLCGVLQDRVRAGELAADPWDRVRLPEGRLLDELAALHRQHAPSWGATLRRQSLAAVAADVVAAMREWALLDGPDADGQFTVLPLAARFRGVYRGDGQGLEVEGA